MNFILTYIVPFLVALTTIVFIHELGHYLVAKWNKVKVEVFSIGFGKEIFGWTDKSGTRWKFCWVPLGGYVKMFGAHQDLFAKDTKFSEEEQKVAFDCKTLKQKSAIVVAGPIANFILSLILFTLIFVTVGTYRTEPIIGKVTEGSIADKIGLFPHDKILSVNDKKIRWLSDFYNELYLSRENNISILVERDKNKRELIYSSQEFLSEDIVKNFGVNPYLPAIVERVMDNSPASQSGIKENDLIMKADQKIITSFYDLQDYVKSHPGKKIELTVLRSELEHSLLVEIGQKKDKKSNLTYGYLGISPKASGQKVKLNPIEALYQSGETTIDIMGQMLRALGQMIVGKRSTDDLGGPIRIAEQLGETIQLGFTVFVMNMAILSVVIGLINLFPIPILDGGHLLFYLIESIVKKPLNEKIVAVFMNIGLIFIGIIFIFTTFQDLMRLDFISNLFDSVRR